jgi:phosphoribosylformylglycinamidine synthase I
MPRALVIRTAGTNCDTELCRAFSLAGAEVDLVHLDALIRNTHVLRSIDILGFPGGFSYGDDIASGRIFAMKIRTRLYPALRDALNRGALVIGICNGFQVMVQAGLLPGPSEGLEWPEAPPEQTLALTDNSDARFHAHWVGVRYERPSRCVWTCNLLDASEVGGPAAVLPVAHGEGRLVARNSEILSHLEDAGQICIRYVEDFNGSVERIAGICDASGRVFGLMPHPERFLDWNRHPFWTRLDQSLRKTPPPGLRVFRNAVEAVVGAHS